MKIKRKKAIYVLTTYNTNYRIIMSIKWMKTIVFKI